MSCKFRFSSNDKVILNNNKPIIRCDDNDLDNVFIDDYDDLFQYAEIIKQYRLRWCFSIDGWGRYAGSTGGCQAAFLKDTTKQYRHYDGCPPNLELYPERVCEQEGSADIFYLHNPEDSFERGFFQKIIWEPTEPNESFSKFSGVAWGYWSDGTAWSTQISISCGDVYGPGIPIDVSDGTVPNWWGSRFGWDYLVGANNPSIIAQYFEEPPIGEPPSPGILVTFELQDSHSFGGDDPIIYAYRTYPYGTSLKRLLEPHCGLLFIPQDLAFHDQYDYCIQNSIQTNIW